MAVGATRAKVNIDQVYNNPAKQNAKDQASKTEKRPGNNDSCEWSKFHKPACPDEVKALEDPAMKAVLAKAGITLTGQTAGERFDSLCDHLRELRKTDPTTAKRIDDVLLKHNVRVDFLQDNQGKEPGPEPYPGQTEPWPTYPAN